MSVLVKILDYEEFEFWKPQKSWNQWCKWSWNRLLSINRSEIYETILIIELARGSCLWLYQLPTHSCLLLSGNPWIQRSLRHRVLLQAPQVGIPQIPQDRFSAKEIDRKVIVN